jgi:squalene-hopene/tetraprenyl-beta-curcumene cyclase
LIAAGRARSETVRHGIEWLLAHESEGGWQEGVFTGVGFPEHIYLRYTLYPLYFPTLALARYISQLGDISD